MRTTVAAIASVLLALGAAPVLASAPASAAQVSTTEPVCPKGCIEPGGFDFVAAPGERNRVTVARESDGAFVVHDAEVPVTATGRCSQLDASTVRCRPLGDGASFELGDGDDELTARTSVYADAGPGDDVLRADATAGSVGGAHLVGGDGDDRLSVAGEVAYSTLDGAAGDDVLDGSAGTGTSLTLYGRDGADRLLGSPHDDTLTPGAGPDRVEGGAGRDRFSHVDRGAAPLVLSLADGRGREDPVVTGVEDVMGGDGPDSVTGDDGPNRLEGVAGDDVLVGGEGDDRLDGGPGRDRLDGGAGADGLDGRGGPDRIVCGADRDRVLAGSGDVLPAAQIDTGAPDPFPLAGQGTDCETLAFEGSTGGRPFCLALDAVTRARSALRVPNPCKARAGRLGQRHAITLLPGFSPGRLASGVVRTGRRPLRLQLTPDGRDALNGGSAAVRIELRRIGPRERLGAPTRVGVDLSLR